MKSFATPPNWRSALELLTAGLLLAALPHLWHLQLWVYTTFAFMLGLLALLRRLGRDGLPRILNWLLGVFGFVLVFANFRLLWGLEAGTALLLLLTTLKVSEIRQRRDAVIAVYLGYFLVLTALLFEQSIPMAFYVPAALVLLTMVLARLADNSGGQTIGYQARTAGQLVLLSLPLMALMFLVFPRLPGPLWALPKPQQQATTGVDGSMSPGDIGALARSSEPAFRVRFAGSPPEQPLLYWRGPVLTRFDGVRWTPTDVATVPPRFSVAGASIDYELLQEPTGRNWVFALEMPVSIPAGVRMDAAYQLTSDNNLHTATSFQLRADLGARPGREEDRRVLNAARRLPPGSAPRTRALATELWQQFPGTEKYVNAVLQHFNREPFVYTLRPQRLTNDRVDGFLFDSREGYCEHYAAAFTVLMRAAGIPARVVTGYQGGEWNGLGDYLLVRQSDAHAWSEVWLPERGWVRVDPTAAVAPERIQNGVAAALPGEALLPLIARSKAGGRLLARLSLGWDSVNYYWGRWVVFFGEAQQRELFSRLGLDFQRWTDIALAMIAGFGIVLLGWLAVFALRRYRHGADPVQDLYRKFCNRLSRCGLPRRNDEGPLAYADRVIRQRPDLTSKVSDICSLYSWLHYAPNSELATEEELRQRIKEFQPKMVKKQNNKDR